MRNSRTTLILSLICALFTLAGCIQSDTSKTEETETSSPVSSRTAATGDMCGGIAGIQCLAEGDYCAMDAGMCLRVADAAGVCTPKPQACTREYRPVCGCDGNTYPNACVAASNGINVANEGECKASN